MLGGAPSQKHCVGERIRPIARPFKDDAWHFAAPIAEEAKLTYHLRSLWQTVEPHIDYFKRLDAKVDEFCIYRSNNDVFGFAVEPDALEISIALNVPFGLSVIIDGRLGELLSQPIEH